MYNINICIFSSIILLVSLFYRIKGDFGIIKEQRQIVSRPQLENNLDRTPGESVITSAITVDDEKFDDNELKKLFIRNFKYYKNLERVRNINGTREMARKTRAAVNDTSKLGTECLSCFASGSSWKDYECYKGKSEKIKCSDAEQCFVELNPQYLRRGCMLAVNRTYYCKCPLCNDKPSTDNTYYHYNSIEDWVFDNHLLQKPLVGLDLMCKVCETLGTNPVKDKNCRQGRNTDYMVCGHNQLCYINIDDEIDYVSRGCRSRPVFNSMYFFCNETGCNDFEHVNPKITFRTSETRTNGDEVPHYSMNCFLTCILFVFGKVYFK